MRQVFLLFVLMSYQPGIYSADWIPATDLERARSLTHTRWIENCIWPTSATLSQKSVSLENAKEDIDSLAMHLRTVLRADALPPGSAWDKGIIALKDLRDGNDFLALRYEIEDLGLVEIYDGHNIYVTISRKDGFRATVIPTKGQLAELSEKVCRRLFNVPQESLKHQRVFCGPIVNAARFGNITFDPDYPPPAFWYSAFDWYSDGENIAFRVSKYLLEHPDVDFRAMASRPKPQGPRKFGSKGHAVHMEE